MLAFFVLFSEKKGVQKSSTKKAEDTSSESTFDEGIPSEFIPQDLSLYSSREKLEKDLEYREAKFENLVNSELKEFSSSHDPYGKDQAAYKKLTEKHARAREKFREIRHGLRKEYAQKKNELTTEDRGLR